MPVPASPDIVPITNEHRAAYAEALERYLHHAGVTGIDLGLRYIWDDKASEDARFRRRVTLGQSLRQPAGIRTNEVAVRIHVEEWVDERALDSGELLPPDIFGVPVNVVEGIYRPHATTSRALNGATPTRTRVANPLQPGVSISHPRAGSGTLGLVVYDNATGKRCMLSTAHVLVGSPPAAPGEPIVQPGRTDGGRDPEDRVARLGRSILDEDGDAAIAAIDSGRKAITTQWGERKVVVSAPRDVELNELVEKSGVATDVTQGRVDGIGCYRLQYDQGPLYMNGFRIVPVEDGNPDNEEISSSGDSGAVWYSAHDKCGLGLHVAGEASSEPSIEHAIACHLVRVFSALDIGLTATPAPPPAVPPVKASSARSAYTATKAPVAKKKAAPKKAAAKKTRARRR